VNLLLARVLWSASCRDHPELRAIKRQKVARHIDKKFGAAGYTEANSRVRAIEEIRAVLDGRVDAILRLQAAIRSDNTGIGDIRPVGRNLARALRTEIRWRARAIRLAGGRRRRPNT
jgi:hypothetical protein